MCDFETPDAPLGFYNALGLNEDCSESDIKNRYRKLALKYHPDRGGDINKFQIINY